MEGTHPPVPHLALGGRDDSCRTLPWNKSVFCRRASRSVYVGRSRWVSTSCCSRSLTLERRGQRVLQSLCRRVQRSPWPWFPHTWIAHSEVPIRRGDLGHAFAPPHMTRYVRAWHLIHPLPPAMTSTGSCMGKAKPEVQVLLRLPGRLHAELAVRRNGR